MKFKYIYLTGILKDQFTTESEKNKKTLHFSSEKKKGSFVKSFMIIALFPYNRKLKIKKVDKMTKLNGITIQL